MANQKLREAKLGKLKKKRRRGKNRMLERKKKKGRKEYVYRCD